LADLARCGKTLGCGCQGIGRGTTCVFKAWVVTNLHFYGGGHALEHLCQRCRRVGYEVDAREDVEPARALHEATKSTLCRKFHELLCFKLRMSASEIGGRLPALQRRH
jgi:hypothetical protein